MATSDSAGLTSREGRRFGLTLGSAFLVFGGLAYWRGSPTTATVFAALAGALVLAGLTIPTFLGPVERGWMAAAHAISKVTTPIVMAAMYLLVVTPVGLARRTFGGNPLSHGRTEQGYWKSRPEGRRRGGSMRRQF